MYGHDIFYDRAGGRRGKRRQPSSRPETAKAHWADKYPQEACAWRSARSKASAVWKLRHMLTVLQAIEAHNANNKKSEFRTWSWQSNDISN
jgi:hypothetical protein